MVSKYSWLSVEAFTKTASLEDAYTKYYSGIPREIFNELVGADPTALKDATGWPLKMGRFGTWILRNYTQGELKLEDLYKVTRDLEIFERLIPSLKGKESVDINRFKTPRDLASFVRERVVTPREGVVSENPEILFEEKYFLETNQARKEFESDRCLIVVPLTLEASKFYGEGSDWCTLFPDRFGYYSRQGSLFIIIFRENPWENRFQFHFESNQFMDVTDNEVELEFFFDKNPELNEFFRKKMDSWLPAWYGEESSYRVSSLRELVSSKGAKHQIAFLENLFEDGYLSSESSFSWEDIREYIEGTLNETNLNLLRDIIAEKLRVDSEYLEEDIVSVLEEVSEEDEGVDQLKNEIVAAFASADETAMFDAYLSSFRKELTDHFGVNFNSWSPGDTVTIPKSFSIKIPWFNLLEGDGDPFSAVGKVDYDDIAHAMERAESNRTVDDSIFNENVTDRLQNLVSEFKIESAPEPHTLDLPGMEAQ